MKEYQDLNYLIFLIASSHDKTRIADRANNFPGLIMIIKSNKERSECGKL